MVQTKDGMTVAIEIARVLAKAPEERLPMILSVFAEYGLTIDGLDELAEWRAAQSGEARDDADVVDVTGLIRDIEEEFWDRKKDGELWIPAVEFSAWLRDKGLAPNQTKKALAESGTLVIKKNQHGYTRVRRAADGRVTRYIVIRTEGVKKDDEADAGAVPEDLGDARPDDSEGDGRFHWPGGN